MSRKPRNISQVAAEVTPEQVLETAPVAVATPEQPTRIEVAAELVQPTGIVVQPEQLSRIDFEVERVKLLTADGQEVNRDAIRRKDTQDILGVVSGDYTLVQHKPAFEVARKALEQVGGFTLSRLNTSQNGSWMYASFQKQQDVEVRVGDLIRPELTLVNSLDGYSKLGFNIGAHRLVCKNGLTASVKVFGISVKHSADIELEQIANQANKCLDVFTNKVMPQWQKMATIEWNTQAIIDNLLARKDIIPTKITNRVMELATADKRDVKTTAWDLYNDYTYYLTHEYQGSVNRKMELHNIIAKQIAWASK